MKLTFPSPEFDDAVAAVCHGNGSDDQAAALNELLRSNPSARDEYILRVELHARLASEADLFVPAQAEEGAEATTLADNARLSTRPAPAAQRVVAWATAIAASVALIATVTWQLRPRDEGSAVVATSRAVAMLNETAGAQWSAPSESIRLGGPLEPGWLKLEAGLAQVVFYSGARVVIEGPAEVQLVSTGHAVCRRGKITVEIPSQARGFRVDTPHGTITDLGTAFGLDVNETKTEVHVFKGAVELQTRAPVVKEELQGGAAAVIGDSAGIHYVSADRAAFASLFELHKKSAAAEALRLEQWRAAGERLNRDPSLLVRFDFDPNSPSRAQLRNISEQSAMTGDSTIVGCQWGEGRWPAKRALEFQGVSDRVRLEMPGEFEALTLSAWVRVRGLDRKLNSLFMCDGFGAGTVHWLIRNDGVLGLTIVGEGAGNYQIAASPPVLALDRFGMWIHLAVVLDGRARRIVHYLNGREVSSEAVQVKPPYRVGTAELGNWNAMGFPKDDPFMIRNFSGAMDEFCLFSRALDAREVHALFVEGRPEPDVLAARE
jgi:hypothetical protein